MYHQSAYLLLSILFLDDNLTKGTFQYHLTYWFNWVFPGVEGLQKTQTI
jgi:hypothetical protein